MGLDTHSKDEIIKKNIAIAQQDLDLQIAQVNSMTIPEAMKQLMIKDITEAFKETCKDIVG